MPANHPLPAETLLANLAWRYAVKAFDTTKKISEAQLQTLLNAANFAPSSYGLQPYKMFVVETPAVREKLRAAAWNQSQITDSSHLVVFARAKNYSAADAKAYVDYVVAVRGTPREQLAGLEQMIVGSVSNPSTLPGGSMETYTRAQTYIALGFLLFAAAQIGADACPMEGFDPPKFDEILSLGATPYTATVLAAVGHRSEKDWLAGMKKVRKPIEQMVTMV